MKSPKIYRILVCRQGRYSRVVVFFIHVTDAAIGLGRAFKNKEMWTKKNDCFRVVGLEKNVSSYIPGTRFFDNSGRPRLTKKFLKKIRLRLLRRIGNGT